jgi:hypothetical protein
MAKVDRETGEVIDFHQNSDQRHDTPVSSFQRTIEMLHIGGASLPLVLDTNLKEAAMAVMAAGGPKDKAKLTLTLVMTPGRVGSVTIAHTVDVQHPTAHGKRGELAKGETEAYVSRKGEITLAPGSQGELLL